MTARRIASLVAFLLGAGASRVLAQAPDGQALYREHCRSCHGANGVAPERAKAQYPRIPTLSDSAFMASRSDDSVLTVLKRGSRRSHDMESFSGKMTEPEMRAVIAYVRTLAQHRAH